MKRNPTHTSEPVRWKHHVLDSIRVVIFGFALTVAAVALLWWTEARPLRALQSLDETETLTQTVPDDAELAVYDGHVVRLAGRTVAAGPIVDDHFGVAADALRLRRRAQVLQWHERIEHVASRSDGRAATTELALYRRDWSDTPIDSSDFRQADSHRNPTRKPIADAAWNAPAVHVHGVRLSPAFLHQLNHFEPWPVTAELWRSLPADIRGHFHLHEGILYSSAYPEAPQVGDVRIAFEIVPPSDVTAVGRLSRGVLSAYEAKAGRPVALIEVGNLRAADLFDHANDAVPRPGWLNRGLGLAVLGIGVALILRPFAQVREQLPPWGWLLRIGYALPAVVTALALTATTLAVRWFNYRPVFARYTESSIGRHTSGGNAPVSRPPSM